MRANDPTETACRKNPSGTEGTSSGPRVRRRELRIAFERLGRDLAQGSGTGAHHGAALPRPSPLASRPRTIDPRGGRDPPHGAGTSPTSAGRFPRPSPRPAGPPQPPPPGPGTPPP